MLKRVILSGGGTGGHIFPALAIADIIKENYPACEILFVGAEAGMEMNIIPKHGYSIQSVWISGFYRQLNFKNILRNLSLPLKYFYSQWQAHQIIRKFKPDLVIGTGGYASFPVGKQAASMKIPLFIQEQNAIPGLVNKKLAPFAQKIFLGNEAARSFFPENKVVYSSNPVRTNILKGDKEKLSQKLGFDLSKPVVLITGGSLGARTLNDAVKKSLNFWLESGFQVIWQCGKFYEEQLKSEIKPQTGLYLSAFLDSMQDFYALADVIVCRAGAMTLTEIVTTKKIAILVPSPNVADDHQTKNARWLTDQKAAVLLADKDCVSQLMNIVPETLKNQAEYSNQLQKITLPSFSEAIQNSMLELFSNKKV